MKQELLTTRWDGPDMLVQRKQEVLDCVDAREIERVILVCDGGDTPAALQFAIIQTATDHVLLPADSGIAARVYFERQAYWTLRSCIYWVTGPHAPLPRHLLPGIWLLRRHRPAFMRLPASELAPLIARWPMEGPQTWEQRKWSQIASKRRLAAVARSAAPNGS